MTLQVGPVPHKADNNAGLQKPLSANGPRCADTIMMARPQQHNERHKEAEYTTATIPPPSRVNLRLSLREESIYALLGGAALLSAFCL